MRKIIVLKIIFICFYLNALAEVPGSIKKLEKKYMKNNEYLYSIGEGMSIKEAQINAYINMADKYFYVGFKADSIFLDKYKSKNMNIAYIPFLEENKSLQGYAEIFDIEFIEEKYNKEENKYYVFSIVNKIKLYSILKNRILKNENTINTYNEYLISEEDPFNRFVYLEMMYILSRKNHTYNKQIEYMNFECLELEHKYDDILPKLKEAENKLTFKVSQTGIGIGKQIIDVLNYDINQYGFNISSANNASYVFQINITLKQVEDKYTHRNNYESHFSLYILNNNVTIHTFQFQKIPEDNYIDNFERAKDLVKYNVEKILREEFSIKLKEFLDNKIKNL